MACLLLMEWSSSQCKPEAGPYTEEVRRPLSWKRFGSNKKSASLGAGVSVSSLFWSLNLSDSQGCSYTFKDRFSVSQLHSKTTETIVINSVVGEGVRGF